MGYKAVEFAAACADHGIEWLEEPLDSRDFDGNAALKQVSKVKISGAERNLTESRLKLKVIREKGLKAALALKKRKESG